MTTLSFQNTSLSVINQNNQIWFSALDIGKALGYSNGDIGVKNIYNRHQDEFTPCMTALMDMQTNGGIQKVRIFSLRGCHLIGMLSHTKVAKDFRKWVLDILDKEVLQNSQQIAPLVEPKIAMELTKKEWLRFASMWFALYNSLEVLATLEKPLRAIGSPFGATAYTHATEYQTTLGVMKRMLEPMLADFEVDPFEDAHYYKALKTLRAYQPKGLGELVRI
ncbi:antirepressor [Mannheimia granulomatis]|uniref:Antirepressor n=1 Tax=Mannheimia granulomatis TaxID=85402 RepID=A0A011NA91_9PAST|nr:P22AR C-terminal domain-containing protein [Mannheimia granulomatis]EXI61492.1 antirepressor [Mannheimia granulomatis]RGE48257.1 antirepressor [Mannheimia granulomatis]